MSKDTTLADELKLLKSMIATIINLDSSVRFHMAGYYSGSLHTLQRLSEDVDPDVYEECERLLEQLRQ